MAQVKRTQGAIVVAAYRGDAKTLLAFDLLTVASRERLAGFTIQVAPQGVEPYYLLNNLRFENAGDHAQDPKEPAFSTINSPLHKFRWVHIPGTVHQGLEPIYGSYTYHVTPRYFDERGSLKSLDVQLTVSLEIEVAPFVLGDVSLGFTRGFTQSQAFVRHFGLNATIKPKDAPLQFDTSAVSGGNANGEQFTYEQQYQWLGFTARKRIFEILREVHDNGELTVDVFAYDLNEPDIIGLLLQLGAVKRARVILDNATLHHTADNTKPEDQFATLFAKKAGATAIKRGKFGRYAHDKVFVVYRNGKPLKVLTGSTNFSVTGIYVNSNHVLVFDDPDVSKAYADVFQEVWTDDIQAAKFANSKFSAKVFKFSNANVPETTITFSPHSEMVATDILNNLVSRVQAEQHVANGMGSVLFAVMELGGGTVNPVYETLRNIHKSGTVFSYGISDNPPGIVLYAVGSATGVLVTGKPINTQLPPPFSQVPNIGGVGHQVHHKFVVCGFNGDDPTVYCGSSNLALTGEQVNGDNLLTIRNDAIASVFAIEALCLVDHFNFLDRTAKGPKAKAVAEPTVNKQQAAVSAGWFLSTDDGWSRKFFDQEDMHCKDRLLFAK